MFVRKFDGALHNNSCLLVRRLDSALQNYICLLVRRLDGALQNYNCLFVRKLDGALHDYNCLLVRRLDGGLHNYSCLWVSEKARVSRCWGRPDNKTLTFVQLCQVHGPVPIAVSEGCKQKCTAINMYAACRRYVYTSSESSAADVCGCGTGRLHGDGDWPRESRRAGLRLCHLCWPMSWDRRPDKLSNSLDKR